MYSHKEFDEWFRSVVKADVALPAGKDELAYNISAPLSGLTLRVYPKIDLEGEWMGGSPELVFVSQSGSTTFVKTMVIDRAHWKENIYKEVSSALKNWREHTVS